ncbi:MAG TPA: hypothetical protein PKG54_11050 [Phycisphaerae bacterium]|nr:hypothetical protein [Phycisphaerae bacterium]HOB75054.1 hypothetical protein [Phycisphaerae bacterium]HOJ54811.1 hypothetical protein [Phycisphaerae bacterium]HOL26911.1 hypothetical protein [Phycisphaerae bacterium]HPP20866.1 hypothetical protein [Phycisphaerae bacterium]
MSASASVVAVPDRLPREVTASVYCGAVAALILLVVAFVLFRAWVADDAFITFRHVTNLLAGHGPVFNPGERVQAFSHPLWFLLLAAAGSVFDVYGWAVALGLVLTVALLGVQAWLLRNEPHGLLRFEFIALLLLSSKTFVEFQTSGLESSLVALLVGWLWAIVAARGLTGQATPLTASAWLCGLLVLTRPDLVFLCGPVMVYVLAHALFRVRTSTQMAHQSDSGDTRVLEGTVQDRRRWLGAASALLPVLGWYGFATIYYGTPLPNTAYAKTTFDLSVAVPIGLRYVLDYLRHEPIQALLIGAVSVGGMAFGLVGRLHGRRGAAVVGWLALGITCHLAYVVSIGGDFMRGRFIQPALVASVVLAGWMVVMLLPAGRFSPRWVMAAIGLSSVVFVLMQVGLPGGPASLAYGRDDLLAAMLLWPTATAFGLGAYALCALLLWGWMARRAGRSAALVFVALAVAAAILLIELRGSWQPSWAAMGGLAGLSLWLAASCAGGLARRGLRAPGVHLAGGAFAVALALGGVPRFSESVEAAIADEPSFYRVQGWHNPFVHHTEALPRVAHSWHRIGVAARRYSERYGPVTMACESMGIISYYAGPNVRIVDLYGLADPYLARGPAPPHCRTGHIHFLVPAGYLEDREVINCLPDWFDRLERMDPGLRAEAAGLRAQAAWAGTPEEHRWRQMQLIVSGPLLSRERLKGLPRYWLPERPFPADFTESNRIRERVSLPWW